MTQLIRLFLLNIIVLTVASCGGNNEDNPNPAQEHINEYSQQYLACKEPNNANNPDCKKVEALVTKDSATDNSDRNQNQNGGTILEKVISEDKKQNVEENQAVKEEKAQESKKQNVEENQAVKEEKAQESKEQNVEENQAVKEEKAQESKEQNTLDSKDKDKTNEDAEEFLKMNIDLFAIDKNDVVLGDKNAKVVVLEYSSPTCYHCGQYRNSIFPQIAKKYVDTNKIAYVIRQFTVTRQDLEAAVLIYCSPMEKRYSFIDILYKQQQNWAYNNKYKQNLINIAKIGGVTEEDYQKCLNDSDLINKLLVFTKAIGSSAGFVGTPSLHIDGKKLQGEHSVQNVSSAIDQALYQYK
ncbi:MAG: thioredoxin domain-containing protein [Rickettsiaceae bacterium]|nr:thioredoxin domain-containing protein [Rickettsiaceae bacterium]